LAIYREKDVFERRNAANEAKKALLARYNSRPSEDDPEVLARKAERQRILDEREKRAIEKEKLKQERLAREAEERAVREAAELAARLEAEARAAEEAKAREAEENERISRLLADEAERKAKRDARYAARKARGGRH
jgi:pyruvate-formate lyase